MPTLVSYVSQFMTLLPAMSSAPEHQLESVWARVPPQYLKAGDVVELGIEHLGEARQRVVACGL